MAARVVTQFLARHGRVCHGACVSSVSTRRYCSNKPEYTVKNHVPHMEFDSGNFTEFVMKDAGKWSQNTALVCDTTSRRLSYGELTDRMSRWGTFLSKRGLGVGSVVAMISPNTVDLITVQYGTIRAGAVYCGINPTCTAYEIASQLKNSKPSMIVCYGPLLPLVQKAYEINQQEQPIICTIGPQDPKFSNLPKAEEILSDSSIGFSEAAQVSGSETMGILYSSGTTGSPKGTEVSHNAGIANLQMLSHPRYFAAGSTTVQDPKKFLLLLPQFHVGGLIAVTPLGLLHGLENCNLSKFDPSTFLQYIKKNKITNLHLVPAVLTFAVSRPEFTKKEFGFIENIMSGAAPVPPPAIVALKERFGEDLIIQSIYGMTEVMITTFDPIKGLKLGYTGQLLPTVETKVIDLTTGESLPPYKDGEICMRSACRMKGYLNNDEATAATIDEDGWVHSGDVGHYDENGYLKVVDRTKELIKVKGLQVSPSEIENVILELPDVAQVSVIGVPHDRLGEAPRAYVITAAPMKEEQIIDAVREKCAKHKHLVGGVRFLKELPKNATGKVLRRELVKMAAEESN